MNANIETGCKIEHEGRTFKAGGAWLCDCTDGYRRGVVYAKPQGPILSSLGTPIINTWNERGIVTDWHGNKIADAYFGHPYRGGFGARMRSVRFTIDGVTYAGRYGFDWSQAVRVRSTKPVA